VLVIQKPGYVYKIPAAISGKASKQYPKYPNPFSGKPYMYVSKTPVP
jgi:hypothetical protein